MTTFTLSANLTADKCLEFESVPFQNQGENQTTVLCVTVPTEMASGTDFFLEFACPHGRRYVSPKLEPVESDSAVTVQYTLPNCVLAFEGMVYVQIIVRKSDDQSVVFKSRLSSKSAFYVNASVGAVASAEQSEDFFARANDILSDCQTKIAQVESIEETVQTALKPDGINNLVGANGKISQQYLPQIAGIEYKGLWLANSSTNQVVGTPQKGDYYICNLNGIYAPDGSLENTGFAKGDWAFYNGTSWDKIDNTDAVTSVNGRTGAVSTFAGTYSATSAYKKGETVMYNNKLYLCIANASAGNIANTTYFKPYGAGNSAEGGGTALYEHFLSIFYEHHSEDETTDYACAYCTVITPSATPIESEDQLKNAIGQSTVSATGYGYYIEGSFEEIVYKQTYRVMALNVKEIGERSEECKFINFSVINNSDESERPSLPRYVSYFSDEELGWTALNICDDVVDLAEVA